MASVTQSGYSLRERKNGKVVKPAAVQPVEATSDSESGSRKYSDIVAARSTSLSSVPVEAAALGGIEFGSLAIKPKMPSEPAKSVASPSMEMEEDENPNPWQTVMHKNRRRASLESLTQLRKAGKKIDFLPRRSPQVVAVQDPAIEAAEQRLTNAEKEMIHKRTLLKVESADTSESVKSVSEPRTYSPAIPSGEGTSHQKGKGIDPRNWGGAQLEPEELDAEAQREQLHLWKSLRDGEYHSKKLVSRASSLRSIHTVRDSPQVNDYQKGKSIPHKDSAKVKGPEKSDIFLRPVAGKKARQSSRTADRKKSHPLIHENKSNKARHSKSGSEAARDTPLTRGVSQTVDDVVKRRARSTKPDLTQPVKGMRPVTQLAPKSILRQALNGAGGPSDSSSSSSSSSGSESGSDSESSSDDRSSSGSSPSSSSSSLSSDSSSSSSSDRNSNHRRRSHGRRRRHRHSRRKPKKEMNPKEPAEYSGAADARGFYRFVTEGTHYVYQGNIARKRRVFVLSYFLKGKAYDFFTQKVAMDPSSWRLKDFFEAMFNYCFPLDFRQEQKAKLRRTFQNQKTVDEYIHDLKSSTIRLETRMSETKLTNFGTA
ncbi:hypothetical protein B0H19DRAFT_1273788 [Mycena capillaripes]|nr:hypothetical protein B0H19DRAFT_1273788 [Mycena capillaripes]